MAVNALAVVPPAELVGKVREELHARETQIAALLGSQIPVERFLTVALHAVNSNQDLKSCTYASIVEAIREAAALRLEPTGLLGDAYLVKYGNVARLMPGYRGLMKLARRTGEVDAIDAQAVYANDAFEIRLGSNPEVVHVPSLNDRGGFLGAYAYARLRSGEMVAEWLSNADIEKIRRSSKASGSGPWVQWPEEMMRKSALRRLMKRLPLTTDAEHALALESEAEQDDRPHRADRSAQLRGKLQARLTAGTVDAPEATETPATGGVDAESDAECNAELAGEFCGLEAGHEGPHKSDEAVWPQESEG